MDEAQTAITAIVSLFVGALLRNTLLRDAINQFYSTDTSHWHWATAELWNMLPVLVIALVIFVLLQAVLERD